MSHEVRSAAYLFVMLLEESVNKLGRKDTTLNQLVNVPGMRGVKAKDILRILRNCIVHTPCDYVECYRLLNKSTKQVKDGLKLCAAYTGLAEESDVDVVVSTLLKFYKENK